MTIPKTQISVRSLTNAYLSGRQTPGGVIDTIYEKIASYASYNIWIHLIDKEQVKTQAEALNKRLQQGEALPLYGIPFAVKDNIDVAGLPTTAGCPEYSYVPETHAAVVQKLLDAGALLIGKTNLDQFATGLVGVRSPYGAVRNAYNPEYISGGSSSGSAVALALEMVSFSLGTDTAGSGRIPAGFNNLVGLKPTTGAINTSGVVPACKSLDCVSIFAHTADDAAEVFDVCTDHVSAPQQTNQPLRIGTPLEGDLFFVEGSAYKGLFQKTLATIGQHYSVQNISFDVFNEAAALLYHGPWIAERMAAIKPFYTTQPASIHPVVRDIIGKASGYTAVDTFEAMYKLESLQEEAAKAFEEMDVMIVPTAPGIFTIEEVEDNPVELNTQLGYYTNYVNLLGLCAIAIPADFTPEGLPFGITLVTTAHREKELVAWSKQLTKAMATPDPQKAVVSEYTTVAVAGLHKKGHPLNHQLTDLSGKWLKTTNTSEQYHMYLIESGKPKPGLIRAGNEDTGHAIEVELWQLPTKNFGAFVAQIPHPLGMGQIELQDGSWVYGFICEGYITDEARDISDFKTWEAYLDSEM